MGLESDDEDLEGEEDDSEDDEDADTKLGADMDGEDIIQTHIDEDNDQFKLPGAEEREKEGE